MNLPYSSISMSKYFLSSKNKKTFNLKHLTERVKRNTVKKCIRVLVYIIHLLRHNEYACSPEVPVCF